VATLRIYDLNQNVLALDLHDLLELLAPRSLQATWGVSTVESNESGDGWFEATGSGGEQLEALARSDTKVSGSALAELAEAARQVIWGEFVGSFPGAKDGSWVTIRAVDSTFFEITTSDESVLGKIRSSYKDVRLADAPIA
jgi:hypothetical protein